eukprot:1149729-Pelagomonas_calceolata.AAC.1
MLFSSFILPLVTCAEGTDVGPFKYTFTYWRLFASAELPVFSTRCKAMHAYISHKNQTDNKGKWFFFTQLYAARHVYKSRGVWIRLDPNDNKSQSQKQSQAMAIIAAPMLLLPCASDPFSGSSFVPWSIWGPSGRPGCLHPLVLQQVLRPEHPPAAFCVSCPRRLLPLHPAAAAGQAYSVIAWHMKPSAGPSRCQEQYCRLHWHALRCHVNRCAASSDPCAWPYA